MARPRFSRSHTFPIAGPTYQRLAMLCLCVSVQQGPLAVVWPLSCPLVHQGEAQRCNPNPALGARSEQMEQWTTGVHGSEEAHPDGARHRQGIGGAHSVKGSTAACPAAGWCSISPGEPGRRARSSIGIKKASWKPCKPRCPLFMELPAPMLWS